MNQLDCLGGYFCPLGTAAKLNEFGSFDSGIRQINKWILVEEIEKFINMTEVLMKNFSARGGLAGGWDNKLREYKNDNMYREFKELEWQLYRYEQNKTIMEERKAYLKEIKEDVVCEEDKLLPPFLIESWIKNGTNLRCPSGTESDRGAVCLG